MSAFFENLDCTTKNVAEFWAIYRGLMLAWDLGYKQVILETDFEYCLHVVIHLISSNHPQAQLIQACWNLVQRDWQCFCKHTHREERR